MIKQLSPELNKAIIDHLNKIKCPDEAYNFCYEIKYRIKEFEPIIATDADYSYMYALHILKEPFPLGEKIIATDAWSSYVYAKNVLKGRFELGESIIATYDEYSYQYARDVLKGPFPLGEPIIATDPESSYLYALVVLKDRFELGEKVMQTDKVWKQYSKNILKQDLNSKVKPNKIFDIQNEYVYFL